MTQKNDPIITALFDAEIPALDKDLKGRTLTMARAHLPPPEPRPWSLVFADYMPPPAFVPGLLISAALVFAVDSCAKMARFLGLS